MLDEYRAGISVMCSGGSSQPIGKFGTVLCAMNIGKKTVRTEYDRHINYAERLTDLVLDLGSGLMGFNRAFSTREQARIPACNLSCASILIHCGFTRSIEQQVYAPVQHLGVDLVRFIEHQER